jgi:hypothetical protein
MVLASALRTPLLFMLLLLLLLTGSSINSLCKPFWQQLRQRQQ